VLGPGDILYIPPGIAHDGVALDNECMTYSVGFRAPSRAELMDGWTEHLLDRLAEDDRYTDPALPRQDNPGEITPAALARLQAMATEMLGDADGFARWWGQHSTQPKYPDMDWRPDQPMTAADLHHALAAGTPLLRNPAVRFAFVRQAESGVLLFVNGRCMPCTDSAAAVAERICAAGGQRVEVGMAEAEAATTLLLTLVNEGALAFDTD
jgi:50S ribosomal protein L16 3-hydroxylase